MSDVQAHKPSVDTVNKAASKLLQTCEPSVARTIQTKLDNLNTRFSSLEKPSREGCEFLQLLTDRLNRLQDEVDKLEDWLIPALDSLEAPDISKMDITELGSILKVGLFIIDV